jgi:hypothetical protein
MSIASTIQEFFFRMRGFDLSERQLESSMTVVIISDKRKTARGVLFKKIPSRFKRISIADTKKSLLLWDLSTQFEKLVNFTEDNSIELPPDFFFSQKDGCVFYSMDGEIFSIPLGALREVRKILNET